MLVPVMIYYSNDIGQYTLLFQNIHYINNYNNTSDVNKIKQLGVCVMCVFLCVCT